ncbi:cytoplasmic dynein 1 intermediate chain 1 isoform X4 [Elephas maximus indicus]|uniref:cytoplasmic dynein 1 intermediate chain 1 isoform X4 n=1 Tax=Elephas maximus indicus TaxID=99487 RepID=UPI00211691C2|nr:cytoplasmic dynein 1 intermediate chain 1 isoform X4 [Elephas maximus indicus]
MSDKSDLKAELERKKQRLAQIREEKKRKEEERKKKEADMQQKKEPAQDDSDLDRKRRETEALLQSIGISPEPPLVPTPMSPSSKSVSTPSEAGSQDSGDLGPLTSVEVSLKTVLGLHVGTSCCTRQNSLTLQWDTDPSVLQLQSDSELGRRLHKLGVSKVTQVDFLPREVVSYSKETQTPLATHQSEEDEEDEEMVEPKVGHDSELENQDKKQEVKEAPPRELTEEEKQQILHSEEFLIFFDRTIRVIERALAEDSDIFFDYSGRELEEKDGDVQAGANLSFNRQFYDEHWSKHRVVTCMDWSLQYPELMVASYNNNEDAPHEPDGVALVWNMKFKKTTPEYIFHCQHPVYCVNVVGTQNAHNLITVSTDGKMCSWSLDMLSTPQESMELVYNKSKSVAVTGMAFPTGDVNNFVVGSEEGTVYTACRHGSKAGIGEIFEGHQGPVTGINCHMAVGPIDFSHLFVTSSFDWTVKLWTTKHNKPLYSFEDNADYVYDVMWSPVHPALFACVDGMGRLDLWNLNTDTEVPTASVAIEGASALNRVRWAQAGKEVAVGDSEGRIWIYDVGELAVPHTDEWTRFARTLMEIRANRADSEEEGTVELAA